MHHATIEATSTDTFLLAQVNRMTISGSIAYLVASSTIAGTTAAKAALCRIVLGAGTIAATVSMVAAATGLRQFFGGNQNPHAG